VRQDEHALGQGRAKLRTWLTVILRNKIVDLIRSRNRALPADALALGSDDSTDTMFDAKGEWVDPPADWGMPDAALESKQFWRAYRDYTQSLSERDALAFTMREELGLSSEEICKKMNISTDNLHVILYRARQKLRSCLSENWFAAP
jgi:RNA polymerase sigma-70 factor, ECF subfamily